MFFPPVTGGGGKLPQFMLQIILCVCFNVFVIYCELKF